MDHFPKMLYRYPSIGEGAQALQDGLYDTRIVGSKAEGDEALAAGWHETPPEARNPGESAPKTDEAPPTRAELEAKAAEIGLAFDGRIGDKKLLAMIAEKLKG